MKKKLKLWIPLLFCAFLLSGSAKEIRGPLCRVVTGVEIACQHKDVHIKRHYTDSDKMEYVLIYLRLLEPVGKPETDPGSVSADVYEITLQLSDGNKKHYKQKDHRYLCRDDGPWQAIAPEQAEGLYRLMRKLPSDRI